MQTHRAPRSTRNHTAGFTLIEIMAVVLIMGMLMSLVGVAVVGQINRARVTTTRAQISQLENALELYRMDNSRYPSTGQGLEALITKPTGTPEPQNYPPGGYLRRRDTLKDGWGTLYQYASPGNHNVHGFDLWSLGADAAPGGEDLDADLGNWDAEQPVDQ